MPGEQSPGGSTIHRYSSSQWAKPQVGLPDDSSLQFAAAREAVFGGAQSIFHEVIPLLPHVDVHTYVRSSPPGNVFSLVTSGMSDLPMHLPPTVAKAAARRVELIFYCSEPKQEGTSRTAA
jgi:hypothetical protein